MSNSRKSFWRAGLFWLPMGFALATLLFLILACLFTLPIQRAVKPTPGGVVEPLRATFLGQDGGDYAGKLCTAGEAHDNVHLHLSGLKTDSEPASLRVDDPVGGGVWANPCDPVSNWFLYVKNGENGEADLYFKPFRDAPEDTEYKISVAYQDGSSQVALVRGTRVQPEKRSLFRKNLANTALLPTGKLPATTW